MKKNIFQYAIVINIGLLVLISIYKLFLVIHEPDFQNRNYKNIELVNSEPDQNTFSFAVIGTVETSVGIFKNKII